MQNLKRKIDKIKAKLLIRQQFLSNFDKNNRLEHKKRSFLEVNKRHLRADVLSLLSSALRPRLLGRDSRKLINFANFAHHSNIPNCIKSVFRNTNRGRKTPNVAKIVVMTTILSISGLFSLNSATSVYADSLTLTIPSNPLSLDLNPSVNNGFATTSGSFNVKTDNSAGYTTSIRAKNESGENSLINGNNRLTSISDPISEDTFKNGSTYINMWGWMPSKLNSESNTNYQIAPGAEEVVLDKTEVANIEGREYNISLAAKVASDTPTGKYENTFVVSATANELPPDGIMQEWDGCDSLEPEQSVRLLDNRDNNVYTVTKLKDGKCWMTENLRITGDSVKAAGVSVDLDSTNTDISGSSKFTIPDSNIDNFNVGSSGYSTTTGKNNDAAYVTTTSYSDSVYGAKSFESGYYTWHTATAGTGTADQTTQGWNAPSSICPKGWRLPTGGSGGDFQTLTNAYSIGNNAAGSNTLRGDPLKFTYAGSVYYGDGVLYNQGSSGFYWSSTVSNQVSAYNLYFDSSSVNPTYDLNRPYGLSVRCVARETKKISDLQYMQDWNALSADEKTQVINSMEEGTQYTLTDNRDNTQYTVAKLKDGKIWMTENLRITGSSSFQPGHTKKLTSSDSDVSSEYTLPDDDISKFNVSSLSSSNQWKENEAAYATTISYTDSVHGAKNFESGYYTWYTATAGTGTADQTTQGWNAPSSICPKGWKLPTGCSGGDLQTLTNAYNIGNNTAGRNTLRGEPLNFTYAGYVRSSDGVLRNRGSYGSYWSSTVYDQSYACAMFFDSSRFGPTIGDYRAYGDSVRCVARSSTSSDGGCFTADTLVDTPNGLIPIKDIAVGTQVYSYDFDSNQIETTTVTNKYTPNRNDVVKLTLDNGMVIQGTYPHTIYDFNLKDWKKIGEFQPGDEVLTIDGVRAKVVSNDEVEGSYDVYDFTVDKYHNYFIVSPNNRDGGRLLVHNLSTGSDAQK